MKRRAPPQFRSTRMFSGLLPTIPNVPGLPSVPGFTGHTREEVQRIQDAVDRRSTFIDNTASACPNLSATTLSAWRLEGYVPAQQYASTPVPVAVTGLGSNSSAIEDLWQQGIAQQGNLHAWATTLTAGGCTVPDPRAERAWDEIITAGKWIAGTLGVAAVIGLAVKMLDVVEKAEE